MLALSFAGNGLNLTPDSSPGRSRPPIYMLDPWEAAQSFSEKESLDFSLVRGGEGG